MGINQAFSAWLGGVQSTATAALRSAQAYGATLQQQTLTALAGAQRAATQPFQQVLQPRSATPTSSHMVRTITPVDVLAGAGRVVSGGVQAAQRAADPIVRAHAPIVQGIQRDIGRAISAVPAAVQSAPAMFQSGTRQIVQAHSPIVQGVQRDAGRAVQALPSPVRSAPTAVQQGIQQIARAHSPIMQGVQRDLGGAIRSVSGANPLRQPAPRVVSSPPPTGTSQAQVQLPGAPTPIQRTAAAYDQMSQRHEAAVRQYNINPDIRQYQQKLSAYNAQLAAHERATSLGRGRQETAARLQSMYSELEGMRSSIDSRKRQELAEIRMMEANLRMLGLPLQAESARLQAESARQKMDTTFHRTRGQGSPAPTSSASPTDGALAAARNYPFNAPAFQVAGWIGSAAASALKGGLVLPTETEARYREHMAANEAYQALRKQYGGNFEGNTFVARNAQDMAAYGRLQSAANKVEKTGQAYEMASQRELFGVPAAARGVGDWLSARDQEISGAALRYAPWLKDAPDVAGRARDLADVVTPGGMILTSADAVAGKAARSLLGKSQEDLPTPREYMRAATQGVAEGWVYQPMTSAAWFGVGGAIGGGLGAAGRATKPVTKALAPVAKATGLSRFIAPAKPIVSRGTDLLWKGVGAVYGADVGYRSVIDENGHIRAPLQQARELGRISATEALPMGAGAAAITRAPALARRAAAAPQRMMSSFRGRAVSPAGMVGGPYPANWQIMDGLRMQALSPSSTIKTVRGSSRYPSSRVEMVEVGPGRRIPKGEMDNFLRRFEVETPAWRRPIPEEYLAREDIAQAYKFGGRGGVTLPGDPAPKAGWYPENWQIMEGLRMREMSSPVTTVRGSSRYPKSRVEMVDVGGGKRIPKGELDSYLRRFEIETPAWRRPIPEEYPAAEDVAEAYKFGARGDPLLDRVPPEYRAKWGGGAPEAFYAGAPMGRSRQIHRQRFPSRKAPSSPSGRTPRIRPTTRTVPVEPSSGQASPLMLGGWGDSALGEVSVTALSPAQVVSPVTDSLSVIGPRNTSILDLGLGSSILSRSGLDLLGRQGVVSVQAQEQGQRQAVLLAPDLLQGMLQSPRLKQIQRQKQRQKPRYARPRLPTAPKAKPRPRARARKSDDEEAERRRRLREAEERAHWEIGPAPGISEMSSMIFGTSILNLGAAPAPGGQSSFGFAARGPARPPVIPSFGPPSRGITGGSRTPGKGPAHTGKSPVKKNGAKKKK